MRTEFSSHATSRSKDEAAPASIPRTDGYGSVGMRGGNLDADVHLVFDSPATAQSTVDKFNAELAKQSDAKALVDKLKITAAKDEVVVKAKLAEADLMQAAGALMP